MQSVVGREKLGGESRSDGTPTEPAWPDEQHYIGVRYASQSMPLLQSFAAIGASYLGFRSLRELHPRLENVIAFAIESQKALTIR